MVRFKTGILKTVNKLPSFDNFSLLQFVSTLHPDVNLENAYIIGEQHIVSSTFELINCLFKKGLKRENISLIGKCYSTNPYVYASMVDRGIDVSTHSLLFDPHKSYDEQYKQFVEKFFLTRLKAINAKTVAKIVVMSDGGVLNQVLQSKSSIFSSPLIGLEQTSSGYEKLKNSRLQYPIINIARSEAKLQYESPFIVRLTLERLFFSLANLGLDPKKVLIIGNGILGNLIYHRLKSDFEVEVFDSDSSKSTISRNEFENTLTQFDLILGCTGKKSLPIKYHHLLRKNAILASISSSDREFDAVLLRRQFKDKITDCHQHLFVNGIYLVNCGFPVIFDSCYDTIDTIEFQLTRSLLLAGIFQAYSLGEATGKLIPLDYEDQREIIQKYHEIFQLKKKKSTKEP